MTEYYVVFGLADGEVRYRGQGPEGVVSLQQLDPGQAILAVPREALASVGIELDPIRPMLAARIDAEALSLLSDDPFAEVHARQESEARSAASGGATPYLDAFTVLTGQDRAATIAEWLAAAEARHLRNAGINAVRQAAKAAIFAATSLPELHAAQAVDWSALG
jgi:hypothetical protein